MCLVFFLCNVCVCVQFFCCCYARREQENVLENRIRLFCVVDIMCCNVVQFFFSRYFCAFFLCVCCCIFALRRPLRIVMTWHHFHKIITITIRRTIEYYQIISSECMDVFVFRGTSWFLEEIHRYESQLCAFFLLQILCECAFNCRMRKGHISETINDFFKLIKCNRKKNTHTHITQNTQKMNDLLCLEL